MKISVDNRTTKGKWRSLAHGSFFLRCLKRITDFIYLTLSQSCVGSFLCSYKAELSGRTGKICKWLSQKFPMAVRLRKIKIAIAKEFEQSLVLVKIKALIRSLLALSLRSWGIGLLSFGIYCTAVYFAVEYLQFNISADISRLYVGTLCIICALPALLTQKSLACVLSSSAIGQFFIFQVAGFGRFDLEGIGPSHHKNSVAFIAGTILGLVSIFISPVFVLLAIAAIALASLVLYSPELGTVMLFFALPFCETMILAAFICFLFLAFMLKYVRGKRMIKIDTLDLCVICFGVFLAASGLFSVDPIGSLKVAALLLCFLLGYFLCTNLITNTAWVKRALGAMLTSVLIVSALGIFQYISGSVATTWQDTEMFSDISGRVTSSFENPNVLGEFLILTIPFFLALTLNAKKFSEKTFSFAMLCISTLCLVLTWSRGAWLGFLFGIVIFMLIYSRKAMLLLVAGLFTVPAWPFVLPDSIINRFTSIGNMSDTSTAFRVNIWKGSLNMIENFFMSGVGLGIDAFGKVYPAYALPAIEDAPHAHNLYLELLAELGVFGLLAFLVCVLFFVRSNLSSVFDEGAAKSHRNYINAGLCGVLAMLLQGLTDHVWYNYRLFLMFWLVIGLTAAIRKTSSLALTSDKTLSYSETI